MPFEIVRHDITNMRADAIVNSANPRPVVGRRLPKDMLEVLQQFEWEIFV